MKKIPAELESRFEAEIEDLLLYMSTTKYDALLMGSDGFWGNRFKEYRFFVPIRVFDEAHPFTPAFLDVAEILRPDYAYFTDVTPRDVNGYWDVCTIRQSDPEDAEKGYVYGLGRHMSVPMKVTRGKPVYSPYVSRHFGCLLKKDGTYQTSFGEHYWTGKRWVNTKFQHEVFKVHGPMGRGRTIHTEGDFTVLHKSIEPDDEDENRTRMALGMQFNRDYDWRVVLRIGDGLGISLVTDPLGSKELFRLRDLPNGAGRRAALRNWVREHWRQSRCDDDEAIKVREHLRGATDFTWNGLTARIIVAPYDLRRAERLRLEREAERQVKPRRRRKAA